MTNVSAKYKEEEIKIKKMSAEEFRQAGYLQELNRQFLHPLGLALEVIIDADTGKAVSFGQVWDYRDDEEGIMYGESVELNAAVALRIQREMAEKKKMRVQRLGYFIQPIIRAGQEGND